MKEIEVKILEIDPEEVDRKLIGLGAQKVFDGILKVKYFDTSDSAMRAKGDLVRVRQFGDERVEVCYKTNKRIEDGFKVCDEYSLEAKKFEDAIELFRGLGLQITCEYEKKRVVYKLKNEELDAEIVIDIYPTLPPFIEIETFDPGCVDKIVSDLGLENHERSAESINGLLRDKYPEVKLNGLFFHES
ncbi:CYTH domain-containing protein [Patescibacteria group bacterium]|nr:CYTH domain-containing protein [Patescibacteria group bacterium]